MPIHPVVYQGWVAITSVITIIATARYIAHWLPTFFAYNENLAGRPLLRILKNVVLGCHTGWEQLTRVLGESTKWTTDQSSSVLGRLGVAIFCSCIVLILVLRWFLSSAGSDAPSSIPLKLATSDVSADAELQSGEPIREHISSCGHR